MMSCIGEPVSWLALERRALGELAGDARAAVDAHLAACPVCAACARQVAEDRVVLRPLPAVAPARAPWWAALQAVLRAAPQRAGGLALAAAAAVLALVVVVPRVRDAGDGVGGGVKGDAVAIAVVGADGVARAVVRPGEALKVAVTCAAREAVAWDVVVFDADGAAFPLAGGRDLTCGNGVPLPGALAIDGRGGDAEVCVVLDPPARSAMGTRASLDARGARFACAKVAVTE